MVLNRFSKSLLQLEDVEGGHMCGKFQVSRYFTFAIARWKLSACTTFEISFFQPVHCPGKNSVSPGAFNQFSKSWPQLDDVEGGNLTGKFQFLQVFYLQWQGETFVHRQHLKFCHFQPVQCASKNPISPKAFSRFSKSLLQLEAVEGGHLGGKFQVRRYCTFAMARWKLSACKTFEVSLFQPVHFPGKNSVSPRAFNQFSKSLPHFDDVEGGHLTGKFQVRRYCTFAMSRWKLSACTTFEISLFQPVHCPSKIPLSP